jgi:hypothetical protein
MVRKAHKWHGGRSELNSVFGLKKWIGGPHQNIRHTVQILPHAFPTMKRELRGKKFRGDQQSAARFDK